MGPSEQGCRAWGIALHSGVQSFSGGPESRTIPLGFGRADRPGFPVNKRGGGTNTPKMSRTEGGRGHAGSTGGAPRESRGIAPETPENTLGAKASGRLPDARRSTRPVPDLPRGRLRRVLRTRRRCPLPVLRGTALAPRAALAVRLRRPGPAAPVGEAGLSPEGPAPTGPDDARPPGSTPHPGSAAPADRTASVVFGDV